MTQTDIGFDTGRKLWYIESSTDNRQFMGVQLVHDSNIKLDNVIIDSYAWRHEKYPDASQGRIRFFDDTCTISKHGSVADSILVEGDKDYTLKKLPEGNVYIRFNLPTMDWTLKVQDKEYVTRNFSGKIDGELLKNTKRFMIFNPKSVLYSKEITLINSNLEIKNG